MISFWTTADRLFPHNSCTKKFAMRSWWRHQMETVSALLDICAGNSPVPGEFPAQRHVTRGFDVFFDLRPDKQLSKQSCGWWFETPSHSLRRHRKDYSIMDSVYSKPSLYQRLICITCPMWICTYANRNHSDFSSPWYIEVLNFNLCQFP